MTLLINLCFKKSLGQPDKNLGQAHAVIIRAVLRNEKSKKILYFYLRTTLGQLSPSDDLRGSERRSWRLLLDEARFRDKDSCSGSETLRKVADKQIQHGGHVNFPLDPNI